MRRQDEVNVSFYRTLDVEFYVNIAIWGGLRMRRQDELNGSFYCILKVKFHEDNVVWVDESAQAG